MNIKQILTKQYWVEDIEINGKIKGYQIAILVLIMQVSYVGIGFLYIYFWGLNH